MTGFVAVLLMLGLACALAAGVWLAHLVTAVTTDPLRAAPFHSGLRPSEHAVSRYHARWYALSLLFLAFDVEMLFMYPWAVVVAQVGTEAVVEMFVFLGVLLAGVVYAWREGALRWA